MQKGRARGPRLRWPPAYDEAPDSRYDWSSQSRPASAPGRRYHSPQGPPSQHTVYRPDVAPELPDERAWSPPARGKSRDAPRSASAFRPPSPCGEAHRRPPPPPPPPREEEAPLGACRAPAAGREQRLRPRAASGAAYSQPAVYHATVGGGSEAVPGAQQFSVNVLPPAWGRSRLAPALPPPRARTASAAPAPAPAPNPAAAAAAVAAAAAAAAAATARALAAAVAAAATPYVTEPPARPSYDDEEEVDGEGEEEEEDLRDQLIEEIEHCTIREELDSEGVPVARTRRTVREQVFRVHDPSRRQRRPSNSTSTTSTAASSASSSKPSSWTAAFSRPQSSSMSIAVTPSASPSSKSLRFVVDVSPKKDPDRIMKIDSINSSGLSAEASQMLGALGLGSGARACGGAAARARARLPGRVAVRLGAVRAALGRLGAEVECAPAASAAAISAAAGDASALYLRLQRAREEAAQVARALDLFRAKIYQTSAAAESAGEAVSARARALVHEMTLRLTEVERDVRDQALRCHAAQQQMKETPPPPVSEPPVTIQSSFLIPEVDFSSEDVFNAEEVSQFLDKVLERLHSVVKLASI